MADVKTFNVRVSNKYNTHAEWLAADPVLLKGELAIVVVPAEAGVVDQEPALLVKVGDGEKKYSELDFISAYAADVHDWAKASEKPEYTADEIDGLADYISGKVQDTNTQYKVVKVADNSFKLQSKELGGEWVDVEGSAFSFTQYDDTALAGRVTTLEGEMDAVEGRLDVLEGDDATAGSVKNEIKKSIEALDLANTYAAKTHGHEITEVTGLEAALAEKAVKTEVATQISNAQSAVQGNVDALAAKVGEPTEGKTVVQMITDSQYDDEEVRGLISANAEAIDAIEADYLKAADKTELEGKITAAQSAAEAKAAELDAAIAARVKAVEDDYLKAADKTELEGRISGAEGKVNTLIGEDANYSVRTIAYEDLAA